MRRKDSVYFLLFVAMIKPVLGSNGRWQHPNNMEWINGYPRPAMNKAPTAKPNIILVLTDDQDSELGSMNFMPKTLKVMRDGGAYFQNAFVTTPMCCPSRSSILTGMYVHNHNTYTNNENCSSIYWQKHHETKNFATYLNNIGYRTGYFGKYLNEYNGTYIPPGWREWVGLLRNSRFYNYSVNFNGKIINHRDNYYKDYFTDLIANDSVTFLKQSKHYFPNRPVMMVLSMPAPHGPEDSAPQYQHLFKNITSHKTPSWNFAPNLDKQWILQNIGKMEPITQAFTNTLQTKRLQTLQSVDDAVEKVHKELENLGQLDNTYIIYTSDHGYHLGQYGLAKGKAMPYETDVRVPFYIRGPGIRKGIRISNIVLNIDIAPTILDLAGIKVPAHMDGTSVYDIVRHTAATGEKDGLVPLKNGWRETFVLERGKVNTRNIKQREETEANVNNMITDLNVLCLLPMYKPPCKAEQKWECRRHEKTGNLKLHKCRHKNLSNNPKSCVCSEKQRLQRYRRQVSKKADKSMAKCRVLDNSSVICDNQVYSSEAAVSLKIKEYRKYIKKLKEIRKQLKLGKGNMAPSNPVYSCPCENDDSSDPPPKKYRNPRNNRKHHKGTERKRTKQQKFRKRNAGCIIPGVECFAMNNEHWKTEPKWTLGPFCACINSANNTYQCIRTINHTHNYLYCEFITGFISYYDLTRDPYQLRNAVHDLDYGKLLQLHNLLSKLRSCSGASDCTVKTKRENSNKADSNTSEADQSFSGDFPISFKTGLDL